MYKTHNIFMMDHFWMDPRLEGTLGIFNHMSFYYVAEIDPKSIGSMNLFGLYDNYKRHWRLIHIFREKKDWWKYRHIPVFKVMKILKGELTVKQAREAIEFCVDINKPFIKIGMKDWEHLMTEEFGDESWRNYDS